MSAHPLILASASPRRTDLLREAGWVFAVEPSRADEDLAGSPSPQAAARELAERKARAVAELHRGEEVWVIGADTIVALGEGPGARLLAKPADPEEARSMLEALSDSTHSVVTGVAVVEAESGRVWVSEETTRVTMRAIRPAEVAAYVASEEWRDKAGGYAIQENADAFVTRLEGGGFDNVVGLPVGLTRSLLERAAYPEPLP
jgi:septum formation protein